MFKFLNLQPEIVGMDINDLTLRMAKLKKTRKGVSLVSYNEVAIPVGVVKEGVIQNESELTKVIRFAFKSGKGQKLDTRYIAVSLPEEKSFFQIITMPKMTQEELESAIPFEAENYIPLSIDKVYLDFQVVQSPKNSSNHSHVLINAMPKTIVDSYVSCFKKAGLIPCILEVESQAIVRALTKKSDTSSMVIIDLGVATTSFIIFSNHSIRFTSSIPVSSQQVTKAISDYLKLPMDQAEKLKREYGSVSHTEKDYNILGAVNPILSELSWQVKKYIDFYQKHILREEISANSKIEKIILCGGGANLKGLPEFLSSHLDIPVELGNPFSGIVFQRMGKNSIPPQKITSFTTALGLALRGVYAFEND